MGARKTINSFKKNLTSFRGYVVILLYFFALIMEALILMGCQGSANNASTPQATNPNLVVPGQIGVSPQGMPPVLTNPQVVGPQVLPPPVVVPTTQPAPQPVPTTLPAPVPQENPPTDVVISAPYKFELNWGVIFSRQEYSEVFLKAANALIRPYSRRIIRQISVQNGIAFNGYVPPRFQDNLMSLQRGYLRMSVNPNVSAGSSWLSMSSPVISFKIDLDSVEKMDVEEEVEIDGKKQKRSREITRVTFTNLKQTITFSGVLNGDFYEGTMSFENKTDGLEKGQGLSFRVKACGFFLCQKGD